jgi:hypothetical protein
VTSVLQTTAGRMIAALEGEASPPEVQKSVTELEAAVVTTASVEPEKKKTERSEPGDDGLQCR